MGIVYIHTNLSNDKAYVGQTWDAHQRELDHRNSSCKAPISKAIQVYGWGGFSHYYSEDIKTQGQLDNLERAWIILLRTTESSHGYNRRFGGGRGRHTEATRSIIKQKRALQGPPSQDGRRRISEAHRGHKYNLGHHPSAETREKMSAARKGKMQTPEWVVKRMASTKKTRSTRTYTFSVKRRRKLIEALKGNKHTLGYRHTQEAKNKMSEHRKGKKQSPEFIKKRIDARMRTLALRKCQPQ